MPIPDSLADVFAAVKAIVSSRLIPITLLVFDDRECHLVGCSAVPRVGEVVEYRGVKYGVVGVRHVLSEQQSRSDIPAEEFESLTIQVALKKSD